MPRNISTEARRKYNRRYVATHPDIHQRTANLWAKRNPKAHVKCNYSWLNKDYRNKYKQMIYQKRSYAKRFILKLAQPENLEDVDFWIGVRKSQLRELAEVTGEKQ